jgi:D-arabinitol dehydrogenase (NADP+)
VNADGEMHTAQAATTREEAASEAASSAATQESMQAVRFVRTGVLELCTLPRPTPGPGQVLLRVLFAGICQTDVHIVAGDFAIRPPRVLGHELTGEVVEVGLDVGPEWIGRTVGIQPAIYCGTCRYCLSQMPEQCLNFRCLGNTDDGGWAEFTTVGVSQLIPLGDLEPTAAVWLEPLACVMHGLSLLEPPAGMDALVIGAGPMGLLTAQALTATGARRVAVADPNPSKLTRAAELGADLTIQVERTGPTPEADAAFTQFAPFGFQLAVDTTGKPVSIERAVRWSARRSSIALFGVSSPDDRLTAVSPADLFAKELRLIGTAGSTPAAFDEARRLLVSGAIQTEPLIWQIAGLHDVPELVGKLARPGDKGKVLIDPAPHP